MASRLNQQPAFPPSELPYGVDKAEGRCIVCGLTRDEIAESGYDCYDPKDFQAVAGIGGFIPGPAVEHRFAEPTLVAPPLVLVDEDGEEGRYV